MPTPPIPKLSTPARRKRATAAVPRRLGVCCVLLASALAGCGSTTQPLPGVPQATSQPRPATPAPETASTTAASTTTAFTNTVGGTVSDEQGNRAAITVGVGSPQPQEELTDPVPTACNSLIASLGQSTSSTVAVPLHVTARLTSSLQVPLGVSLSKTYYLEPKSREVVPLSEHTYQVLWATSYSNTGPECPRTGEQEASQVMWAAEEVTPNVTKTWDAWLVLVGAITPNDPSGEDLVNRVLIEPTTNTTAGPALTPHGSGWVRCSVSAIGGSSLVSYLAVDPTTAEANGCTASS